MSYLIIKSMLEGTISHFFASNVLIESGISYEEALQEMIQVLIHGMKEERQ